MLILSWSRSCRTGMKGNKINKNKVFASIHWQINVLCFIYKLSWVILRGWRKVPFKSYTKNNAHLVLNSIMLQWRGSRKCYETTEKRTRTSFCLHLQRIQLLVSPFLFEIWIVLLYVKVGLLWFPLIHIASSQKSQFEVRFLPQKYMRSCLPALTKKTGCPYSLWFIQHK